MSMTFLSKHITEFTFPDGQPHIKIERFNEYVTCRITNGDDLVKVCLLLDTYCKAGKPIDLMVLYTMGERMDRQISEFEPCTTDVVSTVLRNWSAKPNVNITILSPHSSAILAAVGRVDRQRHDVETESVFYDMSIKRFLKFVGKSDQEIQYRSPDVTIVMPDKGAFKRVSDTPVMRWWPTANIVVLDKTRELSTGKITGMKLESGVPTKNCIILDDLCDGGATFVSAAKILRENGAKTVGLSVVKGIFSKGTILEGIDFIATTNAYKDFQSRPDFYVRNFV